jgi:hypothetical protein
VDDEIRRRALRSAAKVAFGIALCSGAALAGCGGKSIGDDDGAEGEQPPEARSGLACAPALGPVDPNDLDANASWDASVYACCTDYIAGRISAEPSPESHAAGLAADPSGVNCCRYVNASYHSLRGTFGAEAFPYEANLACCDAGVLPEDEAVGPFCTPWGPPVPPALDAELEAAA